MCVVCVLFASECRVADLNFALPFIAVGMNPDRLHIVVHNTCVSIV